MTNDKDLWSDTNEIPDKIKSYVVFIPIARSEKIMYKLSCLETESASEKTCL